MEEGLPQPVKPVWQLRHSCDGVSRPADWFPGAGGEVEGVEAGLDVEDSASSSIANLMLDLPPLVEMVRLAVPPASSTL